MSVGGGPRLVVGTEQAQRDSDLARDLLLALAQLFQVSRFHDLDNVALEAPLEAVSGLLREMCGTGQRVHLLADDDQVFVNRRRVRSSNVAFQSIGEMLRLLRVRGLVGLEFRNGLTTGELRSFLRVFHAAPRDVEDAADRLQAALDAASLTQVALVRPSEAVQAQSGTIELDESRLAALLYAKAVVILRESLRCWEDEPTRRYLGARAKRVVQQIITLAEREPRPFLWLLHVKEEDEYLYTHSANVALLSILTGLRLGLDRNEVCDLGTSALFHDMGRIGLPSELLEKDGEFTEEERREMARHPIHGVNLLLRLGSLNEALLKRLVVVFEHNIAANGYPREAWSWEPHLFSRIVAVADAYDAMTTRRRWRPASTPDEAVRELTRQAGSRYDADVVRVFRAVLGIYPLGTLVRLDTGEAGLVFHVDPASPRRPLVKLVIDPVGAPIADGPVIDLAERVEGGSWRRSILGTEDPCRLGIHVPGYLTEAP